MKYDLLRYIYRFLLIKRKCIIEYIFKLKYNEFDETKYRSVIEFEFFFA